MVLHSPWITPAEVIDPPLIPHALDDEFDTGVLSASWNRVGVWDDVNAIDPYANFAGVNGVRHSYNSLRPSWLMVQNAANSAVPNIYKDIAPPANVFYWIRCSFNFRNASQAVTDSMMGFGLYDAAFSNGVTMKLNDAGTVSQTRAAFYSIAGGAVASSFLGTLHGAVNAHGGQAFHCLGIQKRGTTYDGWGMSTSGIWQHFGQVVHATAFTRAPIYFGNSSALAPGCMLQGVDFFRVKEGKFLP